MTPPLLLLLLFAVVTFLAPPFGLLVAGLLVHHGLWSLEWAGPIGWLVVTVRYLLIGRRRVGRPLGSIWLAVLLVPYVLALIGAGVLVAHFWHETIADWLRWPLALCSFVLALILLGRPARWLPKHHQRWVLWLERIPHPQRWPVGSRRAAAAFLVIAFWPPQPVDQYRVLAEAFHEQGLELEPQSIRFDEERLRGLRSVFASRRTLALAHTPGQLSDVYLVRMMFDHEGRATRVTGIFNLSRTAAVAETDLALSGRWAAWIVRLGDRPRGVVVADLGGESTPNGPGWGPVGRFQRSVTNLQETGQVRGVAQTSLDPHDGAAFPAELQLRLHNGVLRMSADAWSVSYLLGRDPGDSLARAELVLRDHAPPRPGTLATWAVDRLRSVSFIGPEGMQWIKGVAFAAGSRVEDLRADVIGVDAGQAVAEELGDVLESLPISRPTGIPEWPPAPLQPLLDPALPAEGQWVDLGRDAIGGDYPPGEGPFVFTFIRVDPKRSYNQVSIAAWDPRRIELHIVAGTEEPRSTLGQQGSGLIPREPAVMKRVVAAFNGGFQAVHGEFGMVEEGRVQLPPKPWAATVLTTQDGVARLGTWPGESNPRPSDDAGRPGASLPEGTVGLRQNLTPLIADGIINPYQRSWWGGVPEGWREEARTVRSGLCMTEEGYLAYFYSPSVEPMRLALAMQRARCNYGLHLDMNAGHAGFEFYRVETTSRMPTLGRPLDPAWEATGKVTGLEGYSYLARLMVRKMPLMNFPRYVHETPRDFFYLTKRQVLPGPIPVLSAPLTFDGLLPVDIPANEYPHFVMTGSVVRSNEAESPLVARMTRLDPRQLRGKTADDSRSARHPAVGFDQDVTIARDAAPLVLRWSESKFSIHEQPAASGSAPGAVDLVRGVTGPGAQMFCLDSFGFLTIVEMARKDSVAEAEALLSQLACVAQLTSSPKVDVEFGDAASGQVLHADVNGGAARLFPSTPVVKPTVWAIPQSRRVRFSP